MALAPAILRGFDGSASPRPKYPVGLDPCMAPCSVLVALSYVQKKLKAELRPVSALQAVNVLMVLPTWTVHTA